MRLISSGFVLVLLLAAQPGVSHAQIYRYTDERGNAHYVDGSHTVPERYRATAAPLPFANAPASVGAPQTSTRAADGGAATIAFTPGQRIITDARINDTTSVRLLVDTGADRTLIAPRALVAAGVSLIRGTRAEQVHGVGGRTETQSVVIESLAVGGARVGRMAIYALDINQPEFEGLLGRDFLQQFTVSIDPTRGVMTIQPK